MLEKKDIKNYVGKKTNYKTAEYLLKTNGFKQIYHQEFTIDDKTEHYSIFVKNKIFILMESKNYKVYRFQVYMEIYNINQAGEDNRKLLKDQKGVCSLKNSSPISSSVIINFPFDTFEFIKKWESEVVGNLNKSKFPNVLNSTEPRELKNKKFDEVFNAFPKDIQELFH